MMYNMDECFIGDSTYGSLNGMNSSSSSFSMSLSESETDQPSTSGCSSEMTHKEKRKIRVKQYLRQLKSMVPSSSGRRGKMGTITALQHVIGSLQKIHDDKDKSQFNNRDALAAELDNSLFDGENQLNSKALKQQDSIHILLSLTDQTVLEASENVSQLLGYPKDSWIGRNFTDFIHRKDLVTFTSSFNIDSKEPVIPSESEKNYSCVTEVKVQQQEQSKILRKKFYFRIRKYKGLQSGYNIVKEDEFSAFEATMAIQLVKEGMKSSSSCYSASSEENDKGRKCIFLKCVPIKSVYKDHDLKVEDLTFHMRHTLFCSYSSVHPNVMPLLGFLPQDMNGVSIFDFYHQDDMEILYSIYQRIVTSNGTPFKSRPIRLKTHNGDWVTVETEWSSFANPWSHRLEFILGQHKVIKYPSDTDVFDKKPAFIQEMSDSQQKFQQKIRQLLLEPISEEKVNTAPTIKQDSSSSKQSSTVTTEKHHVKVKLHIEKCSDRKKDASSESQQSAYESLGRHSNQIFSDHENSLSYEQLNYANSIKRYLLSQQRTYSSSSEKKTASCEEEADTPCTISTSTADPSDSDFEVDLSIPKPPSFGSSTKVLLSEHEQREDMASGAQIEDQNEESMPPTPVPSFVPPVVVMPPPSAAATPAADKDPDVLLTQDVLHQHTKQQEELFVCQSKQENLFLPKIKHNNAFLQEQQRKRSHSPDKTKGLGKVKKPSRIDNPNLITPPFPLQNIGLHALSQGSRSRGSRIPQSYMDYMLPAEGIHPMGTPRTRPNEASQTSENKTLWPYYPQSGSGASFFPQVMGGFYQGGNMYPPMISQEFIDDQQGSMVRMPCQRFSGSDLSSSMEGSSLYFLDSDNQNSSGQEEHGILKATNIQQKNFAKSRQRQTEPPWLETVHWTKKLAMNYTLPQRKTARVLKEDKKVLSESVCSDMSLKQMLELKCQIESDKEETYPIMDEEAEYLCFVDEGSNFDGEMDWKSDNDNEISLFQCESHSHGIENPKDSHDGVLSYKQSSDRSFKNMVVTSNKSDDVKMSEEQNNTSNDDIHVQSERTEYQEDKDSSSLENDSTCSKLSSELTPSDQRSAGENGSSLKESDDTSSKGSVDQIMKNFSESDKDSTRTVNSADNDPPTIQSEDNYNLFFIIPPIVFTDKMNVPPWLINSDMNPLVEMQFVLKTNDIEKCLEEDSRRLKDTVQPDLVKEQMNIILEDKNLFYKTLPTSKWSKKPTTPFHSNLPFETSTQEQLKMGDKLFDDLFASMFKERDEECHVSSQEKCPDLEDVSSFLDEVD